ncbi:MAG: hypothetical protein WDN04_04990 [Rhodospirillales bacterium]
MPGNSNELIDDLPAFYASNVNLVGDSSEVTLYLLKLIHVFAEDGTATSHQKRVAKITIGAPVAKTLIAQLKGYVDYYERTFSTTIPEFQVADPKANK